MRIYDMPEELAFEDIDISSLKPKQDRSVTMEDLEKFDKLHLEAMKKKLREQGITDFAKLDVATEQDFEGEGEGEEEEEEVVEAPKTKKRKSYKSLKKRVTDLGFKVKESELTPPSDKKGGEAKGK